MCQNFVYLQKNKGKKHMETIITWAKENFQLILLALSVAGVVIAVLSLILEVKKKKDRQNK